MGFFGNLFGNKKKQNPECDKGTREFIDGFVESDVYFLSLPLGEGIELKDLTQEKLLEKIKEGAMSLKNANSVSVFYDNFTNQTILPLFSETENAHAYWGDICKKLGQVIPVGMLQIKGREILSAFKGADLVVLNPKCPDERTLDRRFIESIFENLDQ